MAELREGGWEGEKGLKWKEKGVVGGRGGRGIDIHKGRKGRSGSCRRG